MDWEVDPPPPRGIRLMSRLLRRSARSYKYGAALGQFLEEEIVRQAVRLGHPTVTSAHLVLAIASLGAQLAATGCRLRPEGARFNEVVQILDRHGLDLDRLVPAIAPPPPELDVLTAEEAAAVPLVSGPEWSRGLAGSLDRAVAMSKELGHSQMGTSHLLVAALDDGDGEAARLLASVGVDPAEVLVETRRSLTPP